MNADEEMKEVDADPEVMENYIRVKAVEVMKENLVLIEQRKFRRGLGQPSAYQLLYREGQGRREV
jgi:hypothetical protein